MMGLLRKSRWKYSRTGHRAGAAPAVLALVFGLMAAGGVPQSASAATAPRGSAGQSVKVSPVVPHKLSVANQADRPARPTEVSWPSGTSATVSLGSSPVSDGIAVRAGTAPVSVQAVGAYHGPSSVRVAVLPSTRARALDVAGVLLSLSGKSAAQGKIRVNLDYRGFAQEYGGNYGTLLRLVSLPACALTTPNVKACRQQTPLTSANDYPSRTVSAQVALGGSVSGMVLAATADPGTEGAAAGTYAATSLKPSESWSEGGNSGSFNYTYPITLPGSSSALQPDVSLAYSSESVDGQTTLTQAQSSMVGDGWGLPDSFIEQSFTSCSDSPEGVSLPSAEATGDECYDGPILTMALNGESTSLVCNADETQCTLQNDDGAVVTHVTKSGNGSGTYNTDYWEITERDGTTYYFGRNELPGYASGDQTTDSVDYEPVYSANSGDPCYDSSGFTSSACVMAYRWHLDYVTNVTGQAMAYYYTQTKNYYGEDNGKTNVPYISDSYLSEVDYGFEAGAAYGTSAPVPDKVTFTPNPDGRCVQSSCTPLSSSSMTATLAATEYPDVPSEFYCPTSTAGGLCATLPTSPAFFSTNRLESIATEQYSVAAGKYENVDTYNLTQTEPATDDGTASTLWLASIQHTGDDTSGGGSSTPISTPSVTFSGVDLPNRVDNADYPSLYRYRISAITSELGSVTGITYSTPDTCTDAYVTAQTASTASSNTDSCYPVYWTPPGDSAPMMDWFESYAVSEVLVQDSTTVSLPEETNYSYGGGAAWHYDDNELVKAKYRTYGQFRGYATVTIETGQAANNPETEEVDTYYRGMDGDWLSSTSTRSVTLTDSQKGTHVDSGPLAGEVLEAQVYNGAGGPLETDTINSYWVSGAVQTRTRTGLPDLTARMTGVAETWKSVTDSDGGQSGLSTVTESDNSYDTTTTDADFGLVQYSYSHTDPVDSAYSSCTTDDYATANTSKNLVGLVSYRETDQADCSGYTAGSVASAPAWTSLGAPASVTAVRSATKTYYDGSTTLGATPTLGEVTMTANALSGTAPSLVFQTESQDSYDSYGRVATATDADGNTTTTSYTVNAAGLTTGEQVTAPTTSGVAHVTSETLDPTHGLTLTTTNMSGVVATEQYDALGRLTSVWENSRTTSQSPNITYAYTVSNSSISGVTTETLNDAGNDVPSVTIYDSLGRLRQTQESTPQGGRLISDTFYDSRGWIYKTNTDYWDSTTTPTLALVSVADNEVANQDDYVFNGMGQQVEDESEDYAAIKSTAVTVYNGDSSTTISSVAGPPSSGAIPSDGGLVRTEDINPLGQVTSLTEYTANPSLTVPANAFTGTWYISGGTPNTTTYAYNAQGDRDSTTNAAGNKWTQVYDLLGDETSSSSPGADTEVMTYDDNGNLLQSQTQLPTNPVTYSNPVSYTYDALNRETAKYASTTAGQEPYGSAGADELASWVYDNANGDIPTTGNVYPIGQVTTETSYSGTNEYTEQSLGFNVFGESLGTQVQIPSSAGSALGRNWTVDNYYTSTTGLLDQADYPLGGGLPAEDVLYGYTSELYLPATVSSSLAGYEQNTTYTDLSQLEQAEIGGANNHAYLTDQYDPHTGELTDQLVTSDTTPSTDFDDTSYAYDAAGLLTGETDERLGSSADSETQCFTYTDQDQLSEAWTATDDCAATPTTSSDSSVGDLLGASSEYFQSYSYNSGDQRSAMTALDPATGTFSTTSYGYSTSHPTALASTTTTGATTGSTSYGYTNQGEQQTRDTSTGDQSLTWSNDGELTGVTTGSTTDASYVYDADGGLLLQTKGSTTTLYLPYEEVSYNSSTGAVSGTRYYSLPGGATAVRTGTGSNYGFEITSDEHGTNTLYLNDDAADPVWRQFDPFGNARGTTSAWVDNRGFLGDVSDTATGLTDVGARWYDSATGSFVSLDPVTEVGDPTQLAGYDYAGNNPVSDSDPTGDMRMPPPGGGGGGNPPSCNIADGEGDCNPPGTKGTSNTCDHSCQSQTFVSFSGGLINVQETDPELPAIRRAYATALTKFAPNPNWSAREYQLFVWEYACGMLGPSVCGMGPGSLESDIITDLHVSEMGDVSPNSDTFRPLVVGSVAPGSSQQGAAQVNGVVWTGAGVTASMSSRSLLGRIPIKVKLGFACGIMLIATPTCSEQIQTNVNGTEVKQTVVSARTAEITEGKTANRVKDTQDFMENEGENGGAGSGEGGASSPLPVQGYLSIGIGADGQLEFPGSPTGSGGLGENEGGDGPDPEGGGDPGAAGE
jgi:RHS repeat-associated protein